MDDSRGVNQEIEEISFQEDGKDQGSGQHSSRKASEDQDSDQRSSHKASGDSETGGNRGTNRDDQIISQEEGEEGNNQQVTRTSESCCRRLTKADSTGDAVLRGAIFGSLAVFPVGLVDFSWFAGAIVAAHQEGVSTEFVYFISIATVAIALVAVLFFPLLGIIGSVFLYKRKEQAAFRNRIRAHIQNYNEREGIDVELALHEAPKNLSDKSPFDISSSWDSDPSDPIYANTNREGQETRPACTSDGVYDVPFLRDKPTTKNQTSQLSPDKILIYDNAHEFHSSGATHNPIPTPSAANQAGSAHCASKPKLSPDKIPIYDNAHEFHSSGATHNPIPTPSAANKAGSAHCASKPKLSCDLEEMYDKVGQNCAAPEPTSVAVNNVDQKIIPEHVVSAHGNSESGSGERLPTSSSPVVSKSDLPINAEGNQGSASQPEAYVHERDVHKATPVPLSHGVSGIVSQLERNSPSDMTDASTMKAQSSSSDLSRAASTSHRSRYMCTVISKFDDNTDKAAQIT